MSTKTKKLLILNMPYVIAGMLATNIWEAWRLAEGADTSAKLFSFFAAMGVAFSNPLPSFHPADLLFGIICGAALRFAVWMKGRNAKKYRLLYRSGIPEQCHPDKNRKTDDGKPPKESGQCKKQKCADRRRFW